MDLNYKNSGVDIETANKTKNEMGEILNGQDKNVLNKVGAFASLYDFNFPEYKNPVLVLKTEEPGSKQLLALQYDKVENVCYDMIHHLINDCIVMGAKPISIQDCIVCGKIEKEIILRMVKAINDACKAIGCSLTGGETSEQPGVLDPGTYVLSSSIIGITEKDKIIDGSNIKENDVVISLEANGLHTNGYSLIREIIKNNPDIINHKIENKTFIDLLLEPHRCYYNAVKDIFPREIINGMAHITGGGIKENLNRILPKNLNAEINLSLYNILPIFKFIKEQTNLPDSEMLRTFNMSTGLCIVANKENEQEIIDHVKSFEINAYPIGKIRKGSKKVNTIGNLNWKKKAG